MKKNNLLLCCTIISICLTASMAFARADQTKYPVVFAHGMMGFDQVNGLDYFGNGLGVFVGDPCDEALEVACNRGISKKQMAFASEVNPLQSSEYRGLELADDIENYMATAGVTAVNIVGHSQGGLDARKAARVLYDRKGKQVVKVLISISSPHRGSPVAKNVLDKGEDGMNGIFAWIADHIINPLLYVEKGDYLTSLKGLLYDDWDPGDGIVTGCKAFNMNYPMDNRYVGYYASIITAADGGLSPLLLAMGLLSPLDIDGDGWCGETDENGNLIDCNGDGAAGTGDGDLDDGDDDGLVGINSQQMGYRLSYTDNRWTGSRFSIDKTTGYVSNLNHPDKIQSTSFSSVIPEDHLDIVGLGYIPYLAKGKYDQLEFYADLIDFIAGKE